MTGMTKHISVIKWFTLVYYSTNAKMRQLSFVLSQKETGLISSNNS